MNITENFLTFYKLIDKDNSFCICHQNIQKLLIQIFNAIHGYSGNSSKELFVRRENTKNLWSKLEFVIPSVNFVLKGKNFLRYFDSVISNSLPIEIREDYSILSFVTKIK